MGSPDGEAGHEDDETQHPVRIERPFYMGVTEVTQAQWEKVVGSNPSNFQAPGNPVEQVSWDDCQSFVQKAGAGLRLPSEAEWNFAASGGSDQRVYPWSSPPFSSMSNTPCTDRKR